MFSLSYVLIGCQKHSTYATIGSVIREKKVLLLTSDDGVPITVSCHEPLPSILCEQFNLPPGLAEDTMVLCTTPFKIGYLDHNTQIITIKLDDNLSNVALLESPCRPPVIVSQFLTHYMDKREQTYIEKTSQTAQVLPVGEVSKLCSSLDSIDDIDWNCCVFVDVRLAHSLGLMHGCWVNVKLGDGVRRKSRPMKVMISCHSTSQVILTELAWYNLGSVINTSKQISLKRMVVKESLSMGAEEERFAPSSSSNHDELNCQLAKQLTIAKLACPSPENHDITDDLKRFFTTNRYLRTGDIFRVDVSDSLSGILMKVVKVNGSTKGNTIHKANSGYTTLYQTTSVHGFLPSFPDPHRVSRSYLPLKQKMKSLLTPFLRDSWRPDPLPFILLAGASGSGKTTLVQQMSEACHSHFIAINCVHLVTDTINSTETRIKDILYKAQAVAPCFLLLRNIQVLVREEAANSDNPRLADFFCRTLTETIESSHWPIIVIGCCEKLRSVNVAMREMALEEILMEVPDLEERRNMLAELTAELECHPTVSLGHLAEHTAGFLLGDLRALVGRSERNAACRANRISIQQFGYLCEEAVRSSGVIYMPEDFQKALESIQAEQSLDLGAPKIPNVLWQDIGGLQKVKGDILDTIQLPLQHPELFSSGLRRSGILLYGPPGTGKTLLAKAVATECSLNFFSVKGPELINMYVGQSEENVREVFHKARNATPCVIFFDELDSLAPTRGRAGDSGGVMDRVVSQLLAELDGLHKSCDVFVIGATNRPDLLDTALLRPGRFDKLVYVGMSDSPSELLTVIQAVTRKFTLTSDCDLDKIAHSCPPQLTGADVYSLCAEAMTNAIKRQIDAVESGKDIEDCEVTVSLQDFTLALKELSPSLSVEEISRYKKLREQFDTIAGQQTAEP